MKIAFALSIIGLAAIAYYSLSTSTIDAVQLEFDNFVQQHNGGYKTAEEYEFRQAVFKKNLEKYVVLNDMNPNATFGVTKFSDRTEEEMAAMMGGDLTDGLTSHTCKEVEHTDRYTKSVSWKNKMTPVKNQGRCGGCWAFAVSAIAEVMYEKEHGGLQVDFSEQQLVDCDPASSGCNGGFVGGGLTYWKSQDIAFEEQYEYRARTERCRSFSKTGVRLGKCFALQTDRDQIVQDLQDGPVAIGVFADGWSGYRSGVVTNMPNGSARHAVALVAYDKMTETVLIKNSWGPDWGDDGYIKLGFYGNPCSWSTRYAFSLFY